VAETWSFQLIHPMNFPRLHPIDIELPKEGNAYLKSIGAVVAVRRDSQG
jgi:hypothetical protein